MKLQLISITFPRLRPKTPNQPLILTRAKTKIKGNKSVEISYKVPTREKKDHPSPTTASPAGNRPFRWLTLTVDQQGEESDENEVGKGERT